MTKGEAYKQVLAASRAVKACSRKFRALNKRADAMGRAQYQDRKLMAEYSAVIVEIRRVSRGYFTARKVWLALHAHAA